jgi:hypothetical protein
MDDSVDIHVLFHNTVNFLPSPVSTNCLTGL